LSDVCEIERELVKREYNIETKGGRRWRIKNIRIF
jgi:hypothetical protein